MTRGIVTKITKISTPRKLPAIRYYIHIEDAYVENVISCDVTSNIPTSYFTQIYTSCSIHVVAITRVQLPYYYKMHAHSYQPSRFLLDYPAKTPLIPLSRISTSNSHILSCVLRAMCACAILGYSSSWA